MQKSLAIFRVYLTALALLAVISCNTTGNTKLLHEFKPNGSSIGKAYVHYNAGDSIFNALVIVNNSNDTLYKIQDTKLYSKKGLDAQVGDTSFLGYKCVVKKDNYITLVIADSTGVEISDNLVIEWNGQNGFELLKTP